MAGLLAVMLAERLNHSFSVGCPYLPTQLFEFGRSKSRAMRRQELWRFTGLIEESCSNVATIVVRTGKQHRLENSQVEFSRRLHCNCQSFAAPQEFKSPVSDPICLNLGKAHSDGRVKPLHQLRNTKGLNELDAGKYNAPDPNAFLSDFPE